MSISHHGIDIHGTVKPKLRGVIHTWAIAPFAIGGAFLIAYAPTVQARVGVTIYTIAVAGMLLASACYHRLRVSAATRKWLRRIDHSMIGVAAAGSYTPVILLLLTGALRVVLLGVLWGGVVVSSAISLGLVDTRRAVRAAVFVILGLSGAAVTPWIFTQAGVVAFVFILAGGVFYVGGALVYARRSPNPSPTVFGFHEVFHTCVVIAVACHLIAITIIVGRQRHGL